MSDKERFDAYMKLAEYWTERANARRQIQWKVSLAFWALIAAAIYSIKTRPPEYLLISILAVVAFLHIAIWVMRIWAADRGVKHTALGYIRYAEGILESKEVEKLERSYPSRLNSLRDWESAAQIWTTILLLLAAYYFVGTSAIR